MSKIIRRARDQLHSVREDGLKRQLNAVRHDMKYSKRTTKVATSFSQQGSNPGFKFSDIDDDDGDMEDFDWINTDTSTNPEAHSSTNPETHSSDTREQHKNEVSSDYLSSNSSDDIGYSQEPLSSESNYEGRGFSPATPVKIERGSKFVDEREKHQSSSLFDDAPDLEEDDFFGDIGQWDTKHGTDPLGLNQPNSTSASLFDPVPNPRDSSDEEFKTSGEQPLKKNDGEDEPVDSRFVNENGSDDQNDAEQQTENKTENLSESFPSGR